MWTIADGTNIDTAAEMEYTEWVELEGFPGSPASFVGNKEKCANMAKGTSMDPASYHFGLKVQN